MKNLYQRNELVRGEFRVGQRRVDLGRITCPLLLLTAEADHLVAPSSTEGIRPHVGSRDVTSMGIGAGHVGLVVGAKAHAKFWPEVTRWTAERSTSRRLRRRCRAAPAPRVPKTSGDNPVRCRHAGRRRRGGDPEPVWWANR